MRPPRITGKARLLDALAEWGRHEALGRLKPRLGEPPAGHFEGERGRLQAIDIVLRFRAPVLARILGSLPVRCVHIELAPAHVRLLRVFDGRPARDYAAGLLAARSESGAYVRGLARGAERIRGPLVATAQRVSGRIAPPITVFEGCHRLAAWIAQLASGAAPYPIGGYLVITQYETDVFPRSGGPR